MAKELEGIRIDMDNLTELQRLEILRYSIEMKALDEKFFIPIDRAIIEKYIHLPEEQTELVLDYQTQLDYVSHNIKSLNILKLHEETHAIKVFKYATYKEMEDIFVFGEMKIKDIEHEIIVSNDGYLNPLEFDAMANSSNQFRNAGLKWATAKTEERKKKSKALKDHLAKDPVELQKEYAMFDEKKRKPKK
jgi:hypothetical protein